MKRSPLVPHIFRPAGRLVRIAPVAAGLALAATVAPAGLARAATPAGCVTSGSQVTCTFLETGAAQSWTVPAGVDSAAFTLFGAKGGQAMFGVGQGGIGAEVSATLPVTPQTVIQVNVGQAGSDKAGITFGGGGSGKAVEGSGGGASDVRTPASDGTYPLASRLLVAGGGGGSGYAYPYDSLAGPGGNADSAGGNGQPTSYLGQVLGGGAGGAAGSADTGSAAGGTLTGTTTCVSSNPSDPSYYFAVGRAGTSGAPGIGGSGPGGGGGGGYYGGGAGGTGAYVNCRSADPADPDVVYAGDGGGGGGSSYTGGVAGATVTDGMTAPDDGPNGEVIISYTLRTVTATTLASSVNPSLAGGQVIYTATVSPAPDAGTVAFTDGGTTIAGCDAEPVDAVTGEAACVTTPTAAGAHDIAAAYSGDDSFADSSGTVTQTVDQAPAFTADTPPLSAVAGATYSYQFAASGTPVPSFSLNSGAPSWLTIDPNTGLVSGMVPNGTGSFSYSVSASSSAGSVTTGTYTVTLSNKADIQVGLSCPASLAVGGTGTCTLAVANAGPALASTVLAGAVVPAQLKVTACSGGCSRIGGVLGWSLGSLPAGQADTLTITVTAARAGTALVAATGGSTSPDPNLLNNLATAAVKVTS